MHCSILQQLCVPCVITPLQGRLSPKVYQDENQHFLSSFRNCFQISKILTTNRDFGTFVRRLQYFFSLCDIRFSTSPSFFASLQTFYAVTATYRFVAFFVQFPKLFSNFKNFDYIPRFWHFCTETSIFFSLCDIRFLTSPSFFASLQTFYVVTATYRFVIQVSKIPKLFSD